MNPEPTPPAPTPTPEPLYDPVAAAQISETFVELIRSGDQDGVINR